MIQGKHLSDALAADKPQYQRGRLNLICAQTGQGKTTAAVHTIPEQLRLEPRRCLILIDTTMGEEEKIALDECQNWGEKLNKPYILNYSKFGSMVKRGELQAAMFDYVACDEIHNLIKYVRIDEANIFKRNPNSDPEVISLLLAHESLSYVAIDTLFRWCEAEGIWWFGLTATADNLEKWPRLKAYINHIQIQEQLIAYEVLEKYSYTNVHALLKANPQTKRLIFAPTIELAEQFAQEIRDNTERNVITLWSRHSPKLLGAGQLEVIEHLQKQHTYPKEVDDIIATEAYATGWNLVDDDVQIVIVHSGNKDIQIQFPGRKRGDWQVQYNYDSNAKTDVRKEQRQRANEIISEFKWIVPERFLNVKLDKKGKEELIKEIDYPKKWTSLKKDLEKDYDIKQTGTGEYYGHIITKKL